MVAHSTLEVALWVCCFLKVHTSVSVLGFSASGYLIFRYVLDRVPSLSAQFSQTKLYIEPYYKVA